MIKYFHELTMAEWGEIVKAKGNESYTWDDAARDYPQPEWCNYPQAVCGEMGCWSLMAFMVTGEDYCKTCDLYAHKEAAGQK